jgi:hypothetical protein
MSNLVLKLLLLKSRMSYVIVVSLSNIKRKIFHFPLIFFSKMDFIEERVFEANGNLKICTSPGMPDCLLDYHEYGLYLDPSDSANYNYDTYNHRCVEGVNNQAQIDFPATGTDQPVVTARADGLHDSSYTGGCVDWLKIRTGGNFPTL